MSPTLFRTVHLPLTGSCQLRRSTTVHGVSSKEMLLTKSAMKELRKHLNFTQIRFHCKKIGGRTFHITTAANSKGEAAVKYLDLVMTQM